ncbi:MAG: DUF4832 domain-containing protein [Pseudonocardiaceae bacterium]
MNLELRQIRSVVTDRSRAIATVVMCLLFSTYVVQWHATRWNASAETSPATISAWSGHNDGQTSTYSFSYTGSPRYLHVFIDSDNAAPSGYRVSGIGADYMVEDGVLHRYSGSAGAWGWSRIGSVPASLAGATAGYTVQRAQTGETSTSRATVVFQTNDATGTPLATTPPYEHVFSPATGPITSYWAENDASTVSYHATFTPVGSWNHVFIDSDSGSSTGFRTGGIGADFMVENDGFYRYSGSNGNWGWTWSGDAHQSISGNNLSWSLPRTSVGLSAVSTAAIVFDKSGSSTGSTGVYRQALTTGTAPTTAHTVSRTYPGTSTVIANPDRGFYHYTETRFRGDGTGSAPLDTTTLTRWRTQENITLVLRIFYLERFVAQDTIDSASLNLIAADLSAARTSGVKLVVRFAYSDSSSADAPPARVLAHIRQLAPVLNRSADVISTLQAGFIGRWGEWYYSDNFASDPGNPGNLNDANWAARSSVLNALLDSTDPSIFIQVRYPSIKQRIFGATVDARSSRVGIHDDCFLAGTDDYGTFVTESDRPWLADQARSVPIGGESCTVNTPRTLWPSANAELSAYRWSFLNADHHRDVLASWGPDGLTQAKQRLGYRLRLEQGTFPVSASPGSTVTMQLKLTNDGYAAPLRTRPVLLVMRSSTNTFTAALPVNLHDVQPGHAVAPTLQVRVPTTPGTYRLYLAMPDPASTLTSRPDYAIQLANSGTWDAANGWNDLQESLTVQ